MAVVSEKEKAKRRTTKPKTDKSAAKRSTAKPANKQAKAKSATKTPAKKTPTKSAATQKKTTQRQSARPTKTAGVDIKRVFIGYDPRQHAAYTTAQYSATKHSSCPISISPLVLKTLPITRRGLTPFTYSRFLTPWLCNYKGWALFLDIDTAVLGDLKELFELADPKYAVMAVETRHLFDRSSMMLINCAHPANRVLTPELIENDKDTNFLGLGWLDQKHIGNLPPEWNHIVGADATKADAKIVRYTNGVPYHAAQRNAPYSKEWLALFDEAKSSQPWIEITGRGPSAKFAKRCELLAQYFDSKTAQKQLTLKDIPVVQHAEDIAHVVHKLKCQSLLDYGARHGLQYKLHNLKLPSKKITPSLFSLWEPASVACFEPSRTAQPLELPQKFDAVVAVNVFERFDEQDIPRMLDEAFRHANKAIYLAIQCFSNQELLSDHSPLYQTIQTPDWWKTMLNSIAKHYPNVGVSGCFTYPYDDHGKSVIKVEPIQGGK